MEDKEATTMDVLVAVSDLSSSVDTAISKLSNKMDTRFDKVEGRLGKLEGRVGVIERTMVTKDYLDRKFQEHKEELHSAQLH